MISTTAGEDEDLTTTMQLAKQRGYKVGNVTTASLTDATPAAPMANVADRGCEGPEETTADCPQDATEYGGPGSIAEQSIDLGVDVLLGGGADFYGQTIAAGDFEGRTVVEQAEASGYTIVDNVDDMQAAGGRRLLGMFSPSTMPTERTGEIAAPGGVDATCTANPGFTVALPTLDEMARTALRRLDRSSGHTPFFLQIEGASIDKQEHAADPCAFIGEQIAFDTAVATALQYARHDHDTLVMISADHGHSTQIVQAGTTTRGSTATLTTADGAELTVSYATAAAGGSQQHTGVTVPIYAAGRGAGRLGVNGVIDQIDIFGFITDGLGL